MSSKWGTLKASVLGICMLMLASAVGLPAQRASAQNAVQAVFFNVGKADAILLMLDDHRILVDTGHKDSYDALEKGLKAYGVTKLDAVIITHTDKDHVGGLSKLLKSDIDVEQVYASTLHSEESTQEHPVYKAATKRDVPLRWLRAGDVIEAGESTLHVLGPISRDAKDEDNNSLVLEVRTPEGTLLLTGDMKKEEEAELLRAGVIPQAAVLKVAHHGEDDSTSSAFLNIVQPQWSVISTDKNEEPETASDMVLTRLWQVKSGVAITQNAELGIVVVLQDGIANAQQIDYQ